MENKFRLGFKAINKDVITQGNLDPAILSSENLPAIKMEVYRILDLTQKGGTYLMYYGLIPEAKIKNIHTQFN